MGSRTSCVFSGIRASHEYVAQQEKCLGEYSDERNQNHRSRRPYPLPRHILCHDLTQIIKGVTKDARFRKGHIITPEDIPVLLSMGKEHLFVWENDGTVLHEDEAAEILRSITQNRGMRASAPKEGKIELTAEYDGVFEVDMERLDSLNDLDDIAIATLPQYMPVKAGTKLAGMRVIPLVIAKDKMEQARSKAGTAPLLKLHPYQPMKTGVVTTGSEVYNGLIEDTFTPVIESKLKKFAPSKPPAPKSSPMAPPYCQVPCSCSPTTSVKERKSPSWDCPAVSCTPPPLSLILCCPGWWQE